MSEDMPEVFDSVVCISCLESARYAGILESAEQIRGERPQYKCDQCGGFLIDGDCYNVTLRP